MLTVHRHTDLYTSLSNHYCSGEKIGFVPTMGALHDGHASLIRKAASENEIVVVSIFVNPTQFGPGEDLDSYPKTLIADQELCKAAGATHIYAPVMADIYPEGRTTYELQMGLRSMDKILCGAKRPGHFNGVLQVVSKLFNIVRPHQAYFGLKDFQQVAVLQTLVKELFFPVKIVECPIIREKDGLAMSSRNRYLNPEERLQALFLSKTLKMIRDASHEGKATNELAAIVAAELPKYPLIRLDYFNVRSAHGLKTLDTIQNEDRPIGLMAAFCGKTRLIDNLFLLES